MNISKTIILGDTLTLREWKAAEEFKNSEAVILLHGIESHSEWFIEIGEGLSKHGYSVLAYDRAGWGLSEGIRGHVQSYNHILKQLTTICASLRNNHTKIHLVGMSWGGMFALYAILRRRIFFDSLCMIAPGIFPKASLSPKTKMRVTTAIISRNFESSFPLQLKLEDFTQSPKHQEYIINDPLRNTVITARTVFETLKMQQFCKETVSLRRLPPTTLLLGSKDKIIKNSPTRKLLKSQDITIDKFHAKKHSLIFEDPKRTIEALVANFKKVTLPKSKTALKVLVMGAGAVGSIVGGYLAIGGCDVTLVGRQKHIEAINRDGLCIDLFGVQRRGIKKGLHGVESVAELTEDFDLVIISVKSFDTPTILEELRPVITKETSILSLQNGVSNEQLIHQDYPENTILAGIICMNLNFARPGHIECTDDKGGIAIGLYSGSNDKALKIVNEIRNSGLQVDYSPNDATRIKWSKMLLNISSNVLNAITGKSYKEILSDKFYGALAVNAIKETFSIMKKEGISPIKLPGYNVEALAQLCKAPNFITRQVLIKLADDSENTVTSMQQDLNKLKINPSNSTKTRTTEISELNGKIVELGKKHNIPTPANSELCDMIESHSTKV